MLKSRHLRVSHHLRGRSILALWTSRTVTVKKMDRWVKIQLTFRLISNYYGQAFYAGGSSTSGNVILGPKKKKFNVGDVFKVDKKFKCKAQSSLVSGCKRCRCRGGSSWGAWRCWRVRWHQVGCSLCFELLLIIAISGHFREVALN